MSIRELNDFTREELTALLHKNTAFYCEARRIADEMDTDFMLSDFLRNVPRGVDFNIGYPGEYMRLDPWASRSMQRNVLEWIKDLVKDYGIEPGINFDKCAEYLEVLDDYSKNIKQADADRMECFIDKQIKNGLSVVLDEAEAIANQFDDDYYLADALLSCEWLDDFYMAGDKVYKRRSDKLIA